MAAYFATTSSSSVHGIPDHAQRAGVQAEIDGRDDANFLATEIMREIHGRADGELTNLAAGQGVPAEKRDDGAASDSLAKKPNSWMLRPNEQYRRRQFQVAAIWQIDELVQQPRIAEVTCTYVGHGVAFLP